MTYSKMVIRDMFYEVCVYDTMAGSIWTEKSYCI